MPRVLALALALVTAAPVTAQAQGGEYVLVHRDAILHARPDGRGERARDPWHGRHEVRIGPYWVLRRVGEAAGFVEVATVPAFRATDHCYPTIAALRGLDLRLFVRADDVAEVTARPVHAGFDDGSALRLTAGVGLRPRGRGRYEAAVRGATLTLEPDTSAIGRSYAPSGAFPLPRNIAGLLAPGGRVDLRGGRLVAEPGRRGPARTAPEVVDFSRGDPGEAGEPPRALLAVEALGPLQGRVRAIVHAGCAEITGRIHARDVTQRRPGRPGGSFEARRGASLRPGTPLYWPDGARAGRVAADASLSGATSQRGGRTCFDHPLRPGGRGADDVLTLCVDRVDLPRR